MAIKIKIEFFSENTLIITLMLFAFMSLPLEMITGAEKDLIIVMLQQNFVYSGQCHLWTGEKDKDGYGVLRIVLNGVRKRLRSRRTVAVFHNNF